MVIQCSVVWKCQATEPDYQPRLHSCMNYRLDKPDCLIKLFFFELIIFESFNFFNLIRLRFFFWFAPKSEHFLWHWERFVFLMWYLFDLFVSKMSSFEIQMFGRFVFSTVVWTRIHSLSHFNDWLSRFSDAIDRNKDWQPFEIYWNECCVRNVSICR